MVMERENMQKCQEYIQALEEEQRKILLFQRELPLCLELVTHAVEACKKQLLDTSTEFLNAQSECSEQITTSDGPIFEEFIPIKRSSSIDEDDELESQKPNISKTLNNDKSGKKSDWLRSVQLWNQNPDAPPKEGTQHRTVSVVEVKKHGGAFHPFQEKEISGNKPTGAASFSCSTVETAAAGGGSKKDQKERLSQKKARRCWSPELHRRFLNALQQLGGSHAATPKQIKELMKIDGLTNDEVKSHLQKFRLHARRPTPAAQRNPNLQAPQFVVVGGIWVPPPPDIASVAEATPVAAATRIHKQVVVPQLPTQVSQQRQRQKQSNQPNCEERASHSHSDGGVDSNSPATSSSTHTFTVSLPFNLN